MTISNDETGSTPPGWYPYQGKSELRWWDGTKWLDPTEHAASEAERTGPVKFSLLVRANTPELRVYENEAWKIMPAYGGQSTGGSLADARAEVIVQNQLQLRANIAGGSRTLGATLLRVTSPKFDFTFSLDQRRDQSPANLAILNQAAEFINTRSRQLHADTDIPSGGFSVADEIAKFAALRDQGILTQAEFDAKKAQLLS